MDTTKTGWQNPCWVYKKSRFSLHMLEQEKLKLHFLNDISDTAKPIMIKVPEEILLTNKSELIEFEESSIDLSEKVYLITWSPNPAEMLDVDLQCQHESNVNLLSDYLKSCKHGIFCVEATQKGVPHYHGWYQVQNSTELHRCAHVKVLERFGMLKITECKHIKIFNWEKKGNGLYYYKIDLPDAFLTVTPNPITKDTPKIEYSHDFFKLAYAFDHRVKRQPLEELMTAKTYYESFYADTKSHLCF